MKCKHCSMDGIYRHEEWDGSIAFYCKHHAPVGSVLSGKVKRDFTPLIFVIGAIFLLSLFRQYTNGLNGMMWMMDFMGIFLVTFGLFKIIDLRGFKEGFSTYDIIAKNFNGYGYIFPFLETGLGVAYLAGYMYFWQNIIVVLLSLLGCISAYIVIQKKDDIECVCLGTAFKLPMTWVTFTENLTMGIMALWMVLLHIIN